jgi:hypothetical protein
MQTRALLVGSPRRSLRPGPRIEDAAVGDTCCLSPSRGPLRLSVGSEGATLLPDKEALISQVRVCKLGADLAVHLPVVHHIGLVR